MGFHPLDLVVVAVIALALFGPKTLQSVARGLGKGVTQAKTMKNEIMSDLSVDDITKVTSDLPTVPRNSRQVVEMLLKSDEEKKEKKEAKETKESSAKTEDKKATEQP